ncbi:acyclic terpene utilization AtuA family protein, partial [Vibrio parahaemolyticus]
RQPELGYVPDFVDLFGRRLAPQLAARKIKVVANAGGVNPLGCRDALAAALKAAGVDLKVAAVIGDDLMPIAETVRAAGVTEMA